MLSALENDELRSLMLLHYLLNIDNIDQANGQANGQASGQASSPAIQGWPSGGTT
jgi:hypothetical protein